MKPTASQTGAPVIYAGRFADAVSRSLQYNEVLDEWEVLPHRLAEVIRGASSMMILDPLSFPFEAMTDEQWDLPVLVVPPQEFDAETLITVFGPALFEHLGPFDRVATADPELWDTLRRRYSWATGQGVQLESRTPGEAADELRPLLEIAFENLHRRKAAHRTEARTLASRLAAHRRDQSGGPLNVLEVGAGDNRWPTSFDLSRSRFSGVYTGEDAVETARRDFPEYSFARPEKGFRLPQPSDTFDVSFSVNFMRVQPDPARSTLVSEMWRVTRPGGRIIILDDFVTGGSGRAGASSLTVSRFVELVDEATAGRVVLDHVESLLYPGEDMFRGGLFSLQKLWALADE